MVEYGDFPSRLAWADLANRLEHICIYSDMMHLVFFLGFGT